LCLRRSSSSAIVDKGHVLIEDTGVIANTVAFAAIPSDNATTSVGVNPDPWPCCGARVVRHSEAGPIRKDKPALRSLTSPRGELRKTLIVPLSATSQNAVLADCEVAVGCGSISALYEWSTIHSERRLQLGLTGLVAQFFLSAQFFPHREQSMGA
jgi:hypothetical protein